MSWYSSKVAFTGKTAHDIHYYIKPNQSEHKNTSISGKPTKTKRKPTQKQPKPQPKEIKKKKLPQPTRKEKKKTTPTTLKQKRSQKAINENNFI